MLSDKSDEEKSGRHHCNDHDERRPAHARARDMFPARSPLLFFSLRYIRTYTVAVSLAVSGNDTLDLWHWEDNIRASDKKKGGGTSSHTREEKKKKNEKKTTMLERVV